MSRVFIENDLSVAHPYDLSAQEWEQGLRSVAWYRGDPKRTAELLRELVSGVLWVRDDVRKRSIQLDLPGVHLYTNLIDSAGNRVADVPNLLQYGDQIYVDAGSLGTMSFFPPDAVAGREKDGQVLFSGTVGDYYFLGGVEEGDHIRFRQQNGEFEDTLMPAGIPIFQYDAQQHEFEALEAQLRAAVDRGLPKVTAGVIRERVRLARLFRENNKK